MHIIDSTTDTKNWHKNLRYFPALHFGYLSMLQFLECAFFNHIKTAYSLHMSVVSQSWSRRSPSFSKQNPPFQPTKSPSISFPITPIESSICIESNDWQKRLGNSVLLWNMFNLHREHASRNLNHRSVWEIKELHEKVLVIRCRHPHCHG